MIDLYFEEIDFPKLGVPLVLKSQDVCVFSCLYTLSNSSVYLDIPTLSHMLSLFFSFSISFALVHFLSHTGSQTVFVYVVTANPGCAACGLLCWVYLLLKPKFRVGHAETHNTVCARKKCWVNCDINRHTIVENLMRFMYSGTSRFQMYP